MGTKQDIKHLMVKEGFSLLGFNGSGHLVWFDGITTIVSPATPSDYRGLKNLRATIRRQRR